MSRWRRILASGVVATMVAAAAACAPSGSESGPAEVVAGMPPDAACQTLTLASSGGPMPSDPNTLVVRWLGTANHELAYRGQVFLLDAYYSRVPPARPLGFLPEDITTATAIFIGHGHGDHISDAVRVAQRTGARVFGGPPSYEFVVAEGLPEAQAVEVKGGEAETFDGVTVQAVLSHHSVRSGPHYDAAREGWGMMRGGLVRQRTPEEDELARELGRGSRDPRIASEGTIGYLFTFDNGFTLFYQDSAGPVVDTQRELMEGRSGVDLALLAYGGFYMTQPQVDATMELVRHFRPRIFMPTHHDETGGAFPEVATFPLFMQVREELPETQSVSPMYRTPVCIDIESRQVTVGP